MKMFLAQFLPEGNTHRIIVVGVRVDIVGKKPGLVVWRRKLRWSGRAEGLADG